MTLDPFLSLPWPVAVLVFSFFLYSKMGFTRKFRVLFLIILFSNLIVCGSRSFFISYVVMFLLYYASASMTIKKALLLVVVAIGMVVVFSTDNILSQRFSESKDDIASVRAGDDEVNGNLSFRLLLTQERLTYISQSVQSWIHISCPESTFLNDAGHHFEICQDDAQFD